MGISLALVGRRVATFVVPLTALAVTQVLPAAAAPPAPPPTLFGETLSGTPTVTMSCDPAKTSSGTFSVSGTAVGPYPGTFTADGSWSIGPVPFGTFAPVATFQETFTITSPVGAVTGTKSLPNVPAPSTYCLSDTTPPTLVMNPFFGRYEATITTASGSYTDRGSETTQIEYMIGWSIPQDTFSEVFYSELPAPIALGPAVVTLSPGVATNPLGATHTVTATVQNAIGQPVPNTTVQFTVAGSVNTTGSCTTDANGECSFSYQGPTLPGQDAITGCAGTNGAPPCGTATKTWVLPVSTPGCQVKNDGWILALDGAKATFGGDAKAATDGTMTGQEKYRDHGASGIDVRSLNILAIVCQNNLEVADVYGQATVNGSGSFLFRIEVTDPDSVGGPDTYGITLDNGYTSGQQPLGGGRVEIQ